MTVRSVAAAAALLFATAIAAPASAATLANTNGGDGYIAFSNGSYFYTLYGSDNSADAGEVDVLTTFSEIAPYTFTKSFKWRYTTDDVDGSDFDPAGYYIGNIFTQLSPAGLPRFGSASGVVTITVNQGETFGAYVLSDDNRLGRGAISFGDVPEPATWALMILGMGAVGGALRRRNAAKATVRFA